MKCLWRPLPELLNATLICECPDSVVLIFLRMLLVVFRISLIEYNLSVVRKISSYETYYLYFQEDFIEA